MVPGGGHRKNNPHRGYKSPARGDKKREEMAGRKRISREYREKGPQVSSLVKIEEIHDFSVDEKKILYTLNSGSNYGENRSRDLEQLFRNRKIDPRKISGSIRVFEEKMKQRDWGTIYMGPDDRVYIYLNINKIEKIKEFIRKEIP